MRVYLLICEAHSDDDRAIGVYSSIQAARDAWEAWPSRPYYPFYRIEGRTLDNPAVEGPAPISEVVEVGDI
jgi:hypothetical protein